MAGLFDFEHYYTEKMIKTDIKLDVSNIPVKSSASSSALNDDGTIDEVNMNEIVTNNVMYRITGILVNGNMPIDVIDRIILVVSTNDPDSNTSTENTYYIALGYPLDDIVESGIFQIPETRAVINDFSLSVGTSIDNTVITSLIYCVGDVKDYEGVSIDSITVSVTPRVRLMNPSIGYNFDLSPFDPIYNLTDQNFWHQELTYDGASVGNVTRAMAATGLLGSLYKGNKWYNKQSNGTTRVVYSYDSFVKSINKLGETAKENNLGIKTVFYDDSYADRVETASVTKIDDWTTTSIKRTAQAKTVYGSEVTKFIDKCKAHLPNPLPDISNDGITALIPTVSDVFKKLYTDKDELASQFTDAFMDTYKSLTSIRGVRSFMSSSLKKKLDSAKTALKKVGSGTNRMLLDLASCRNLAEYYRNQSKIFHRTSSNDYKHGVRMISEWGTNIKLNTGAQLDLTRYHIGVYNGAQYDGKDDYAALVYRNIGNNLYFDWQKASVEMTVAEIKNTLCEYFTGMFNAYNNVSEGEDGYVEWYYDSSLAGSDQAYRLKVNYVDTSKNSNEMKTADLYVLPFDSSYDTSTDIRTSTYIKNIAEFGYNFINYMGTSRAFVDVVMREIAALLTANIIVAGQEDYYDWNAQWNVLQNDEYKILVAEWDTSSTKTDVKSFLSYEPAYLTIDDLGDSTTYTINDCVKFSLDVMGDALDEIDNILTIQGIAFGPSFLLIQKLRLREANSDYDRLTDIIDRIKWYQLYTNESVFDNKTYIDKRNEYGISTTPYVFMPARFLVPVQMYKKVKVKYKRFGRTRHKTVKRSIGVRWCEVTFVDNDVYEAYPQNNDEPMQFYEIGQQASIIRNLDNTVSYVFNEPIEGDTTDKIETGKITQFTSGILLLVNYEGVQVNVTFNDSVTFNSSDSVDLDGNTVYVVGIYVPLENTAKSDDRTKVRIEYKMPYIPYDAELRRWAFMTYGAFDQDPNASESREVPADPDSKVPGWVIFKPSSKRIGDLRASMGIYDAVSILVGILRNTFGASCVELTETMRSIDDQELMSSGGGESTFLSWHNYGLAVKILINDPNTGLPIEDGSDEFNTLIDVAEAFTKACGTGAFGKPLNVIWCGRLKIGANNFVWEFLPIGVGHKDIVKAREATLNQEDPVASLGYVNVNAEHMVYQTKPDRKIPYILASSSQYINSMVINGEHYVNPKYIRNFVPPHDIVLNNIIEFCNLIQAKMQANGASLNNRASIYEWKSLNDKSYKQLLLYYGLTGSITAAKALVSGEYVEMYKDTIDCKYSENCVDMVKDFLGNLYQEAKIYVEDAADGGAWLSLADGKLHIKCTDIRPIYNQNSKDNFFGEKIAPVECTERGLYIDGVFRNEAELEAMGYQLERVSETSFIDGFEDGNVVGDDAMFLHSLVATQIKEEFDKLRELFENYGGSIMYDHFADGPNASMADMLENEFGLISGQDLIGFDELRAIFNQKNIEDNAGKYSDGTTKGAGGIGSSGNSSGNIYEKVVSNAELAGVRKASLTKEHINVTVKQNSMTTEQLYKAIMKGTMTQANDMFSK